MDALSTLLKLQAQGGGGQDSIQLASMRGARRTELAPRAAQGDRRAQTLIGDIDEETAMDPMTGAAEQERIGGIEDSLQATQTFNRPDVTAMRAETEGNALRRLLLPAQAKANATALMDAQNYEQQLNRDAIRDERADDRAQFTQGQITQRTQMGQQGSNERLQQAQNFRRAMELRKEAGKVNPLMNMFTGRRQQLEKEADGLAGPSGGPDEITHIANVLANDPRFAGQSIEQLISSGVVEANTPEELQILQSAFAQAQGMQ